MIHFHVITSNLGRDLHYIGGNRDGIPESLNPPIDRGNERLSMGVILRATRHDCHLTLENKVVCLRLPESAN